MDGKFLDWKLENTLKHCVSPLLRLCNTYLSEHHGGWEVDPMIFKISISQLHTRTRTHTRRVRWWGKPNPSNSQCVAGLEAYLIAFSGWPGCHEVNCSFCPVGGTLLGAGWRAAWKCHSTMPAGYSAWSGRQASVHHWIPLPVSQLSAPAWPVCHLRPFAWRFSNTGLLPDPCFSVGHPGTS